MAFKTADWARHYPALLNKRRTNKSVFRLFCCTGLLLTGNGSAIVSLTIKDPLSTKSLTWQRNFIELIIPRKSLFPFADYRQKAPWEYGMCRVHSKRVLRDASVVCGWNKLRKCRTWCRVREECHLVLFVLMPHRAEERE
ncbi:hypothetical protein CEXT_542731 [Caerostris extrusa]|uniref:Uncharacterized protein n=1 Tax=Caerostris extrusa TaxID=172846 RepID=A0AAV4RJF8_CAEEX|nr:hypothetical protein CEXT_542731 [Caerostris extrusa]